MFPNPRRQCWGEQVTRYGYGGYRSATPTIVGAIIGGVLGHGIGKGDGRTVSTIAGTVLGASVARDVYAGGAAPQPYTTTVQRCAVHYEHHREERIDGYRVTYRFRGETYVTRLDHDPGDRIRVAVTVSPAD